MQAESLWFSLQNLASRKLRKMKSENSWEFGCQESEMDRVKKILQQLAGTVVVIIEIAD